MLDLGTATARTAALVAAVRDDQLSGPTPCPRYTVGDVVEHIGGLTLAFTAAATKTSLEGVTGGQAGDASRLAPDWRTSIPAALAALAEAWQDPAAWEGMSTAGGIEMPGSVCGMVALEEVVVHGWDVARSTGQPYDVDQPTLDALAELLVDFAPKDPVVNDGTLPFGPAVEVPGEAALLDRVVALAGRDPAWSPTAVDTDG